MSEKEIVPVFKYKGNNNVPLTKEEITASGMKYSDAITGTELSGPVYVGDKRPSDGVTYHSGNLYPANCGSPPEIVFHNPNNTNNTQAPNTFVWTNKK